MFCSLNMVNEGFDIKVVSSLSGATRGAWSVHPSGVYFSGIHVAQSIVFFALFVYHCLSFLLAVVFPVLLRFVVAGFFKKSLKISKAQSESVYRRRTDNTMAKRKSTKGQTTINKAYI
jgi:hypothetical protein